LTCAQLNTSPDAGSHHADFQRVNAVLATVEPAIQAAFEDAVFEAAAPAVQDVVANFNLLMARETAWVNAETCGCCGNCRPLRERSTWTGWTTWSVLLDGDCWSKY
jgi:hypothetical protein